MMTKKNYDGSGSFDDDDDDDDNFVGGVCEKQKREKMLTMQMKKE
jgi:hypothetical protein